MKLRTIFATFILFSAVVAANGQTNVITYQGTLNDGGSPANGTFDLRFQLYALISGTQTAVGTPVERLGVTVTNGAFTVNLDFSHVSGSFTGFDRFIGIAVKPAGGATYTTLTPTQQVTSTPYAIRSQSAQSAGTATNSTQLGGIAASQYVVTNDPRMTDSRTPTAGSTSYIQNTTVAQASSNFNISGDGTAGGTLSGNIVTAAVGFNIGSARVLSVAGTNNTLVGEGTGNGIFTSGSNNTLVGSSAGDVLTSGSFNSFFGSSAGAANSAGIANSFFGAFAGSANTSGTQNSFFGRGAGSANTTAGGNSYFGAYSGNVATGADNSFFGSLTGLANTTGYSNSFFGGDAGKANTTGFNNSFFGARAGTLSTGNANSFFGAGSGAATTIGGSNSFFGTESGESNTSGTANSFFGAGAGRFNAIGQHNSFFGAGAGRDNTFGHRNSFYGYEAGRLNTSGLENAFFGRRAGFNTTEGDNNTFLGVDAGMANTVGTDNVAIGHNSGSGGGPAGENNVQIGRFTRVWLSGSNNTAIGANSSIEPNSVQDGSPAALSYATAIGAGAKAYRHNSIWLGRTGGEDEVVIPGLLRVSSTVYTPLLNADRAYIPTSLRIGLSGLGSDNVCLSSNGTFAICVSSLRYKSRVSTFKGGLDLVRRLRPITFDWIDSGMHDLGFGAEEVAAVEPLLGRYDKDGTVQGVKYDRVGVVLVNAVNEQQDQIDLLKTQIEQQKQMIESLKQLVCAQNLKATVCSQPK